MTARKGAWRMRNSRDTVAKKRTRKTAPWTGFRRVTTSRLAIKDTMPET